MLCKVPVLMLMPLQVGVTQRREASLVSVELVLKRDVALRLQLVNIVLYPLQLSSYLCHPGQALCNFFLLSILFQNFLYNQDV